MVSAKPSGISLGSADIGAEVRTRLYGQTSRFISADTGGMRVHVGNLADLVTEIVAEYTDHLVAERDAMAEDLAYEMNAHGVVQHTGSQGRAA